MKINLTRPLIAHLKQEIEKGDVTWALLWANEYKLEDPYLVKALFEFAKKTDTIDKIDSKMQKKLLNGDKVSDIDRRQTGKTITVKRKLKAPSINTLAKRFVNNLSST